MQTLIKMISQYQRQKHKQPSGKIEIKEAEHKQSWSNNVIPNDED